MKNLFHACFSSFLLFFFISCEKQAPQVGNLSQELSVIEKHLADIGVFEPKQTSLLLITPVSEQWGELVYRYDEDDKRYDYYFPLTVEKRYQGFEPVNNLIPLKSIEDVIWPGNLIQGRSVLEGSLAPIPIASKRKPGRVYLHLVSGQDSMKYYKEVKTLTGSAVVQAMNEILTPYTSGFPANVSYIQQKVHSVDQMAYFLDMSKKEFMDRSGGVFNDVQWNTARNRIMVKLKQTYFTMVYEFNHIKEVFSDDIMWSDLQAYTAEDNPMCYISSVDYGRYFVLLYESEYSTESLSSAINKVYGRGGDVLTDTDRDIFRKANVKLLMVGGDAQSGLETITGDADKIKDFIIIGATFSKHNVGAPIAYTLRYLYNSATVPVYKDIDVKVAEVEYIPEEKENEVEIEIRNIFSDKLRFTKGAIDFSNAQVRLNYFVVSVYENGVVERSSILSPLFDAPVCCLSSNRYYTNMVCKLGVLGKNTKKKIVLNCGVNYNMASNYPKAYIYPYYSKRVEFSFDERTQRWQTTFNDSPHNVNFKSLVVKDNMDIVDHTHNFDLYFQLDYTFKANRETY